MSDKQEFKAFSDWRGKFILIISGAAVLLILTHLYFSAQYVETSIVEQFLHNQVTVAKGMAKGIKARLRDVGAELSLGLARDPRIMDRDRSGYTAALQAVFEELEGFVHGLYRLSTRGIILARYPPKKERLGATIPEKALLEKALAATDEATLAPIFRLMSGELGLSLISPVIKGGAPVGVVRAVIDLSTIVKDFILPIQVTEHSYAFLMDESGFLLHHPRKEYVGKTLEEVGEGAFFKMFPRGKKGEAQEGYFNYQMDGAGGELELIAFSSFEMGGQRLALVLVTPRGDIAGPIKGYKRRDGAFAGFLLLIVAFAAYKYTESRNRRALLEQERGHLLREREMGEEVQATRAYLSTLLSSAPDAIISTDLEGNVSFFNPVAEALLGYRREEVIGKRVTALYESEEVAKEVMRRMRMGSGFVAGFETTLRAKDGSLIPVLISASILYDEEGREAGTVGFNKDLRERRQAESETRLLQTTTLAVSEAEDLQSALGVALQKVCEATGWVYGEAWIPSADGTRLEHGPFWHVSVDVLEEFRRLSEDFSFPLDGGFPGRAWSSKQPLWMRDVTDEKTFLRAAIARDVGLKSAMAIPVIADDEVVAVMVFFVLEPREENERFIRLVSAVASQLGTAIQRKQAEEVLEQLRRHNEMILDSVGDGIYGLDLNGNTTFVNPATARMIGWEVEEMMGQPQHDILHHSKPDGSPYPRGECPIYAAYKDGIVHHVSDEVFWRKDGTSFPVEYISTPIRDERGELVGAVVTFRDITERKQKEEALERAHDELKQAYETLEKVQAAAIASEKLAAMGRLTAGVSHEILNPLNIISLINQRLLDDSDIHPELAEDLREMEEQSNRIVKIAQGLLYFSRHRPPERREVDINGAITQTLRLLEHDLRLTNIAVELSLAEDVPTVMADLDQLQQVILNLLTNARDVMPKGGRLLIKTTADIQPLFSDKGKAVEFRVEDSGPGIDPEHLNKLFDPFFTTKEEGKGTGLGLSICQGIVEAHGGTMWADNLPGGGAAFVVRLGVEGED